MGAENVRIAFPLFFLGMAYGLYRSSWYLLAFALGFLAHAQWVTP